MAGILFENISIKINLDQFKQKLYKKLNINSDEFGENHETCVHCKIRHVEHKPSCTQIDIDSVLKINEYVGLKGSRSSLIKKNFDPLIINDSELGDRLIRQSMDIINNFSEPIYANIIPIDPFDADFGERKKVFVYRQKLKINKLISQLIVYLEDGKIFVEGNLTNIWLDSEVINFQGKRKKEKRN